MALQLIIGDTSVGKSNLVCKRLAQASAAKPEKHFIAIVPEQATLLMQKDLIAQHPDKVITNIDIVSFGFLAELIFKDLGMEVTDILDDTGKVLILRRLLDEKKDDLLVYGKKVKMPGFVEEVKSILTELKQYDIDDNTLFLMQQAAEEKKDRLLYAKLQDLRLIYRTFEEEIADHFTTTEEILSVLAKQVAGSEMIRGAEIYMDGFTGFTPVQYRLIGQLIKYAANVTVTVTLPFEQIHASCEEHELFYLSNRTYFKLLELADEAGVEKHTEVCSADPAYVQQKNQDAFVYAAGNPEEEMRFAACHILELVKNQGYRFRDIAIVVSDMETYHNVAETVFTDAGISFFLDHKRKLSENSFSHYLLAAIGLAAERFSYHAVFSYLKTGLSDLTFEECCKLENYCLEFGIKGIRSFREPFTKNRTHGAAWDLDEINAVRAKLMESADPFCKRLSGTRHTAGEYLRALQELFEKNRIAEKLNGMAEKFEEVSELSLAKEYEQLYEQITALLQKIETILPDELLRADEYAEIVKSGLEEIKVGIIPPSLDAVVIGDLTRTRLSRIKALFLIGANEGKIPVVQGGNGFFSQRERQFLKTKDFELAPPVLENICTQRFYIYLMLSKPEEKLWITYSRVGMDGSSQMPSYIIHDLPFRLNTITVNDMPAQSWDSLEFKKLAAHIKEPDEETLNYFAKERPEQLKQLFEAAFFSNRQLPIDTQVAQQLYGEVLRGSVSRYEKFAECPFKHFMQYGIGAEVRPEFEIRATDIGTIYHDSLDRYSKKLLEKGYTFRDISDEESHLLIKECVEEAAEQMETGVLESTARNTFLKERILKVSEKVTDVLRTHVKNGKYEPAYFELPFRNEIAEDLMFTGKIDRVDLYDGENLFVKIIDYKSGNKAFDVIDIYTGVQLQLAAYMSEALKKTKEEHPDKQVEPGGIYYYLIQDKFIKSEEELQKKYMMNGITNCEKEALDAIDTTVSNDMPGASGIVDIAYDKKGLSWRSKVASTGELNHMLDFVNEKLLSISRRIKAGEADIDPLYKADQNHACLYCDYKNVCKFEDGNFGTEWNRTAEKLSKKDTENEVFGRLG